MSLTSNLKWKRAIDHLKFLYTESQSIKELVHSAGPEFQEYYESFCINNHVDRHGLNQKHHERVKELYGIAEEDPSCTDQDEAKIDSPEEASIVLHSNPSPSDVDVESEDAKAMDEAFSRLFKNIALKLHPDRIDKNLPDHIQKDMISRFQEANKAMDEKKYFILLDVAMEFGLKPPRNKTVQMRWMKREMMHIRNEIQKQKNTYSYKFTEAESDEERDELIKQFLYQLFRFKLPENS